MRFTKEEVDVRKYCAIFEFLTLYPSYISFYKGAVGDSEKALPCNPAEAFSAQEHEGALLVFRYFYVSFSIEKVLSNFQKFCTSGALSEALT